MEDTATTPVSVAPTHAEKAEPALTLTDGAIAQVKDVIVQQGFEGYVLTVRVVPAGCSGLGYDLNLVKESKPGDVVWQQEGVTIATDAVSAKYLSGTQVDYVRNETAAGFKFSNPNAKANCGCGESFAV